MGIGGVQSWPEPVTDIIVRRNLIFDNTTSGGGKGEGINVGTSKRERIHHSSATRCRSARPGHELEHMLQLGCGGALRALG